MKMGKRDKTVHSLDMTFNQCDSREFPLLPTVTADVKIVKGNFIALRFPASSPGVGICGSDLIKIALNGNYCDISLPTSGCSG